MNAYSAWEGKTGWRAAAWCVYICQRYICIYLRIWDSVCVHVIHCQLVGLVGSGEGLNWIEACVNCLWQALLYSFLHLKKGQSVWVLNAITWPMEVGDCMGTPMHTIGTFCNDARVLVCTFNKPVSTSEGYKCRLHCIPNVCIYVYVHTYLPTVRIVCHNPPYRCVGFCVYSFHPH